MENVVGAQKRDLYLDSVAGVLIIDVMMLHAGILKNEPFSVMHFLGFFMPWFFYKAGAYHKYKQKIDKKLVLKYFNRYIVPILFCGISTYVIELFSPNSVHDFRFGQIITDILHSNVVLWFLYTLLVTKIITLFLPKDKELLIIIISGLFILSAYLVNSQTQAVPLLVKEIVTASLYYCLGCYLGKYVLKSWKHLSFLLLIYCAYIYLQPSYVDIRIEYVRWGEYGIAIIGNMVGIIVINSLFFHLTKMKKSPLCYIGKESMGYLIMHMQLFPVCTLILQHLNLWNVLNLQASENIPYLKVIWVLLITPCIIEIMKRLKIKWLIGG